MDFRCEKSINHEGHEGTRRNQKNSIAETPLIARITLLASFYSYDVFLRVLRD
jgi:hypothetical protein